MSFWKKLGLALKQFIAGKHRKKRKAIITAGSKEFDVTEHYTWIKEGGDIIPGDVPVPVGDTFIYTLYFTNDKKQVLVTSMEEKILWIIPFTYDEYIIEFPNWKYTPDQMTCQKALDEVYEAEHWNWRTDVEYVTDYDCGVFWINRDLKVMHAYKIADSDYSYLRYRQ